uniref:Uncharacterized protein n=1 Tax=Candidatus Kentrum sp. DK TaxID=2126562 RepID=A0A450RU32_9GAMM|nr:MAG: hypothetical protein BECKDK2373C_GA0170839_100192 [Candidatus Kentron sp. DK]VFJ48718.1 MAG: hypothetical protein BECKDK2373B_GA0170837_102111 [Candidatus Kentron sp. DK]
MLLPMNFLSFPSRAWEPETNIRADVSIVAGQLHAGINGEGYGTGFDVFSARKNRCPRLCPGNGFGRHGAGKNISVAFFI